MSEALTCKYNAARIVRLTSGEFALFTPWTNSSGMELLVVGPIEVVAPLIPTFDQVQSHASGILSAEDDRRPLKAAQRTDAKAMLRSLGLLKPHSAVSGPLLRRI